MASDAHLDGPADPRGRPQRSPEGVDLTLVRWTLSMTPTERIVVATAQANAIARMHALARR